jgi:hypothetical protein
MASTLPKAIRIINVCHEQYRPQSRNDKVNDVLLTHTHESLYHIEVGVATGPVRNAREWIGYQQIFAFRMN